MALPIDWISPHGPLYTAHDLGVRYVDVDLSASSPRPVSLGVVAVDGSRTDLCGRSAPGLAVPGGCSSSYITATMNAGIVPGNRSLLAKLTFCSTQCGVAPGEHGLAEIRLVHTSAPINGENLAPLRIRVDNGCFYVLDLRSQLIAGSDSARVFLQTPNMPYTITALLFQKGIYARLRGADVPYGAIDISIPDGKRYIPGYPGFGLAGNPGATGGEVVVRDWLVTPVGPLEPKIAAIGDSITAGLTDEPEAESYVHLVTRALGQEFTLNTGSGGATTALDLQRFPIEIAPFRPGIVWIEGGTNDLNWLSAEKVFANIRAQIALITWGGRPLLSTVPPRNSWTPEQKSQCRTLNAMIRGSGFPCVDRHRLLACPDMPDVLNPMYDFGDGCHIFAQGSLLVAEEAIRVIGSLRQPVRQPDIQPWRK